MGLRQSLRHSQGFVIACFFGGNLGLITGDDGVILIDGGMEQHAQLVVDAVEENAGQPVDFLINTHVHGDHTGSNIALSMSGAHVVTHDNIRTRMLEVGVRDQSGFRPPKPGELPVITFSDAMTFYLNGMTAHLFHPPVAHTDGDAWVHFPGVNVVHAGDLFFNGLFPFIDLDSGGSVDGFLQGIRDVLAVCDDETKIISGHGPLGDMTSLQAAHDMIEDSSKRIKAMLDDGQTGEEIVAANPLADYHDGWNWGFITTERWTQTLVRYHSQ